MTYSVKELFHTLQGEGAQAGRAAVFCRFTGCNLWSGRESHRSAAVCKFCDTAFVGTDGDGGGKFQTAKELVDAIEHAWPEGADPRRKYVVCTGGEPLLQTDSALIEELHRRAFTIAVETNGSLVAPPGIDWICVSPKAAAPLNQTWGNELKLVFPQTHLEPNTLSGLPFDHFFLQPMDGPLRETNTRLAIEYCARHPQWRLSLQTHKILGIR